jgi:hypothetical protein
MRDRTAIEQELARRLQTLKDSDPTYAFDRDGWPGAIAAIRGALPLTERELFDAVIEDFECELAAYCEALMQMVE